MNCSGLCPRFLTPIYSHSDLLGLILIFHCFCMTKEKSLRSVVRSWALNLWCGLQSGEQLVASVGVSSTACCPWALAPASLGSSMLLVLGLRSSKRRGCAGRDHHLSCQGSLGSAPCWQQWDADREPCNPSSLLFFPCFPSPFEKMGYFCSGTSCSW